VRLFALALAAAALVVPAALARDAQPPASWLAQAMCVHRHEGPWSANTGNGYFGGMQFAAATWRRMKGSPQPALRHPGDPAYPFAATQAEQLEVAWRVWLSSGRSWQAWGDVGALCARAA
jgi:Transglycosylase-like domain